MNWEFVEYLLSKFYTVSRAVFAEEATWLFHNLLCALSPPSSLQSTCSCSHARHANESENALNSNSHSHFFYFLSFVLRILHNGCSVKGGARGQTAPKYSEKTWSLYACASGAHWGTIFWTCTRTGQSIYRSFSRSLRLHKGWREEEGVKRREKVAADWGRDLTLIVGSLRGIAIF